LVNGRTLAISASIAPAIFVVSVYVPIVAAVSVGLGGIAARKLSKFRVDDYKTTLAIGCEEASKWSTPEPTSPVDANAEDVLEKELQNRGQPIPVWISALVHQCLQGSLF
jgi:hypothetical protein